HPKIMQALKDQADKVTLTSRAFHNDQLGPWYEKICKLTNKDMALPMNTGAEAVETAIKAARRWAYDVKGIEDNKAEIIACEGIFTGVQWQRFHYHLKKNISEAMAQCFPELK